MDAESRPKWQRLGQLLAERRARIDPRYTVRKVFAAEVGVHQAVLRDIETAARDNYSPPVRAAVEQAYRWEAGSIQRVLDGGFPIELTPPGGFGTWSEFPAMGVETRHVADGDSDTVTEPATAKRLPSWFVSEVSRRGLPLDLLMASLEQFRNLADHFDYTLGELLLNARLASEGDLVINERPVPPSGSKALVVFDDAMEQITESRFLSPKQRKKAQAFAADMRRQILEENSGDV